MTEIETRTGPLDGRRTDRHGARRKVEASLGEDGESAQRPWSVAPRVGRDQGRAKTAHRGRGPWRENDAML